MCGPSPAVQLNPCRGCRQLLQSCGLLSCRVPGRGSRQWFVPAGRAEGAAAAAAAVLGGLATSVSVLMQEEEDEEEEEEEQEGTPS